MAVAYLDWLTELFDEAQVPYTPESAVWLDQSLRRIAAVPAGWKMVVPTSGRRLRSSGVTGCVIANVN